MKKEEDNYNLLLLFCWGGINQYIYYYINLSLLYIYIKLIIGMVYFIYFLLSINVAVTLIKFIIASNSIINFLVKLYFGPCNLKF